MFQVCCFDGPNGQSKQLLKKRTKCRNLHGNMQPAADAVKPNRIKSIQFESNWGFKFRSHGEPFKLSQTARIASLIVWNAIVCLTIYCRLIATLQQVQQSGHTKVPAPQVAAS